MSQHLVFMMGQFEATFPRDRQYTKNHMWARRTGETLRFGFTSYAVRLLQDVYFLEWSIEAGVSLKEKQQIGFIESSKAESDLYAPLSGTLTTFNEALLSDPSAINIDKHDQGWLFEIQGADSSLLTAEQYIQHLESVWEITQRTIKGQLNE